MGRSRAEVPFAGDGAKSTPGYSGVARSDRLRAVADLSERPVQAAADATSDLDRDLLTEAREPALVARLGPESA